MAGKVIPQEDRETSILYPVSKDGKIRIESTDFTDMERIRRIAKANDLEVIQEEWEDGGTYMCAIEVPKKWLKFTLSGLSIRAPRTLSPERKKAAIANLQAARSKNKVK